MFYPDRDGKTYPTTAAKAKAVCRGRDGQPPCPVMLECLFFGLVTNDHFGIWGGMSPRERNALRRGGDLDRYPSAASLRDTTYYGLIQGYLRDRQEKTRSQGDRSEVVDVPERDEAHQHSAG
jgi:transcription factor WhiB